MEPKQIVILLLGIMVVPVVLIVVGVSNWIVLDQDDLLVASEYDYTPTGENVLKSYYQQTYICDNTFTLILSLLLIKIMLNYHGSHIIQLIIN